jgi:pectate lyase
MAQHVRGQNMTQQLAHRLIFTILLLYQFSVCLATEAPDPNESSKYLDAVRTFADNVLKYGRDTYGPKHTPLFVDGLNIHTHEPVKWRRDSKVWILSNLASQQNLFRVLVGLTAITGDPKYKQAAIGAIEYAFENLRSPNGLLHWGGHVAYDAQADRMCMEGYVHELKYHYPYYELMWEVDREATREFIESFWSAHILDWSNLDMNRHGDIRKLLPKPWKYEYKGGPVFFQSRGLSFLNTGSDLYYAGSMLYRLSGAKEPLVWSKRLAHRYVQTRNPKTGIAGYQYTQLETDRAQSQFGSDFKEHLVLEGTLFRGPWPTRNAQICQLLLAEMLGENGAKFTQWALEELTAWGKIPYRKEDNSFIPMLTDGTSMEGYRYTKDGYFGPKGTICKAIPAGLPDFWMYALAYRLTGDGFMWQMARDIARGNDVGDIGEDASSEPRLEMGTTQANPNMLLGFLELFQRTQNKAYLDIAERIGSNILDSYFHKGFFIRTSKHLHAKFDKVAPLVLLHLATASQTGVSHIPQVWPTSSYFHCPYDGFGRTYDWTVIYPQTEENHLDFEIFAAVHSGDTKEILELISKGADINATTGSFWGDTPLHYAGRWGYKEIVELLLTKGADVNTKNNEDQTPVDIALSRNRKEIVDLLIAKGADVSSIHLAAYLGDAAKVIHFIEQGSDVNIKDQRRLTPLHYAARQGHKKTVELLLANGADVNSKGRGNRTAAEFAMQGNHNDVVELLVSKGADISPLHMALYMKDEAKAKSLIEGGADVNKPTPYGTTPLHRAVSAGFKDLAELLISKGANVNAKDNWDRTPLHRAVHSSKDMVELLIAKGADVNVRNREDRTPLWYAKYMDYTEIVELLRKHGAKE